MKKIILMSFALFALVTSCKKKAVTADPDYEGYWAQSYTSQWCNFYLDIDGNSHAKYSTPSQHSVCQRTRSHEGKAKIGKGKLTIGLKTLKIDLPPTTIDTLAVHYDNGDGSSKNGKSVMKMKLDGVYYYKIIDKQ
jgi:hypothetical protein